MQGIQVIKILLFIIRYCYCNYTNKFVKKKLKHKINNYEQKTLFTIFNNIIRSSPSAREAVLDYWATVIKLNQKRAQMHVDPLQVGTDGFLVNLTRLLLSFAEPFMDYTYSKVLYFYLLLIVIGIIIIHHLYFYSYILLD